MTSPTTASRPNKHARLGAPLFIGLALILAFFIGSGVIAYFNIRALQEMTGKVAHTHEVMASLEDVFSLLKDAETGQRGFLLTGNERYLTPYTEALVHLEERLTEIQRLTADNPDQQARIPLIRTQLDFKKCNAP